MIRSVKINMMYSFCGIAAGGALLFVILQCVSLIITKAVIAPSGILRVYAWIVLALTLLLVVCGISLVRHEGFRPANLIGVAFGLLWTAGNWCCLYIAGLSGVPQVLVVFAQLLGCYIDFALSGMLLMAFIAARHMPAYDKDFVIIPGCSISKQGGLLPLLKGRTNRAIRFAWDQERAVGKPARYIPTGGQGPDEIMSEGSAMEFYLLSHGAEQYEVFPEKESVNTYENMLFSKRIIDSILPGARTCFVTTNYHVLRSGMLAKKAGLDAEGLASTTKWYFWPNGLARELIAILSMYRVWQFVAVLICLGTACVICL